MHNVSEKQALHLTAAGPVSGRSRYRVLNVLYLLFVAWLCMKTIGCVATIPGPWGPEVGGQLPSGHTVCYRSRPIGRETEDQLVWINSSGTRRELWIQQFHAGPALVTVRAVYRKLWTQTLFGVGLQSLKEVTDGSEFVDGFASTDCGRL